MRIIIRVCFGLYLGILSVRDIRKREIPILLLGLGLVFVPLFILSDAHEGISGYLLSMIPGVVFLVISYLSRGQLGQADAGVLICVGLCIGFEAVIVVISVSLISIALFSMVMLIVGKLNRKSTLPYIPFVLLGYIFYIFMI